ncbi:MAG: DUF1343 domain-containing protein [Flavobacteriaceae bacterium]|nr:DUF1343 domain-containing protein [Flavobacteriaceae bacterium]
MKKAIAFSLPTLALLIFITSCKSLPQEQKSILFGAQQTELYISKLKKHKNIAIVANQTSVIFNSNNEPVHLIDSLLKLNIPISKVFAPEHGFRGKADAGEYINDTKDNKTGLPIISLYGGNKKPKPEQLTNVDLVVFDIQDVGVRFYTYISTLHYIMESCAELNIPVMILDRPNPNGHYIDGPLLKLEYKSFVGMHPIPIVYGMTIGEYGKMINGEKWLTNEITCDLTVIPLKNYTHDSKYSLPIKPSPNLPNDTSINLYPSICFFEGTVVSCGRGTEIQFQIFGDPKLPKSSFEFEFTPTPNFGSKYPKHKNELCYGKDLRNSEYLNQLNLEWLVRSYKSYPNKSEFFNSFFVKLAGTNKLQEQIENNIPIKKIKASWKSDLDDFKSMQKKYLIY